MIRKLRRGITASQHEKLSERGRDMEVELADKLRSRWRSVASWFLVSVDQTKRSWPLTTTIRYVFVRLHFARWQNASYGIVCVVIRISEWLFRISHRNYLVSIYRIHRIIATVQHEQNRRTHSTSYLLVSRLASACRWWGVRNIAPFGIVIKHKYKIDSEQSSDSISGEDQCDTYIQFCKQHVIVAKELSSANVSYYCWIDMKPPTFPWPIAILEILQQLFQKSCIFDPELLIILY